eukprot:6092063-Prymnesium_polylepis.1
MPSRHVKKTCHICLEIAAPEAGVCVPEDVAHGESSRKILNDRAVSPVANVEQAAVQFWRAQLHRGCGYDRCSFVECAPIPNEYVPFSWMQREVVR